MYVGTFQACSMEITSQGGYDYAFVDVPPDRVICVICHLPSREAHMTECCGHVFCKSCLNRAKATQYTACSMCKHKEFNTFSNKQVSREVQGLRVYCANKEKGCDWRGEVKDIKDHLKSSDGCQMEDIDCPNQCSMKLKRRLLTKHVEVECQYRKVECAYCHEKIKQQFMSDIHLNECPKFPLLCPNGCKRKEKILREDMEAHRNTCPLELISCQYHKVGCGARIMRKRKKQHEDDKMKEHLQMATGKLAKTEERVSNLELMVHQLMGKTVGLNPPVTAAWSVQLTAMETFRAYGLRTCPVIVRLSDFSEVGVDWYSGTFYSHFQGYKIYLNVDIPELYTEDPSTLYISVNLFLAKGPHDLQLKWPLRAKFEVALLNQLSDSEHHSMVLTFHEDLPRSTVYRVCHEDDDSTPVGYSNFISWSDLRKSTNTCQFYRDECLYFRVIKL